jgi:ketosteroid isomerase-like protein
MISEMLLAGYEMVDRTGELDTTVLDPQIEWRPPLNAPTAGVYRGVEQATGEFMAWSEPFEEFRWEPQEILDPGLRGGEWRWMVTGRMSGLGRASGIETATDEFHWTLRGGRAVRMEMYLDRSDALRAGGLAR